MCAARLRTASLRSCGSFRVSPSGRVINIRAYPCDSSPNALIIHYTANDHVLRNGELVLMDAGGEYQFALLRCR